MAHIDWLQVDGGFSRSAGVKSIARALGLHRQQVAGMFLDLWAWAADDAPDGWVRGDAVFLVEDAAEWRGEAGAFVREAAGVYLLEVGAEGSIRLKGWDRYARLVESRQRAKARKQKQRGTDAACDIAVTSQGRHADVTGTKCDAGSVTSQGQGRDLSLSSPSLLSSASKGVQGEAKPGDFMDSLTGAFREVRGHAYSLDRRDEAAVRVLMGKGEEAEVLRRWRLGLQRKRYPTVSALWELVNAWNHCAAAEEAPQSFQKPAAKGFSTIQYREGAGNDFEQ